MAVILMGMEGLSGFLELLHSTYTFVSRLLKKAETQAFSSLTYKFCRAIILFMVFKLL